MLTLLEWAKYQPDELVSSVVEIFANSSPILQQMPFKPIFGSSFGEGMDLIRFGGDMDVDKFLVETDETGARARYIAKKAKNLGLRATKIIFECINKRLENTDQEIIVSDNGLNIIPANYDLVIEKIDDLIDSIEGTPNVIYMSKAMRRVIKQALRHKNSVNYTENHLRRQVLAWGEIPIEIIEEDENGNQILDTSIYAVRFGVDNYFSGLRTDSIQVLDLGEQDDIPAYRTRFNLYGNIQIWNPKSIARLKGLNLN